MRLLKLFAYISLCLTLSFTAYAHPGRTDANGGHTDHSTGEYHYHHGYSAHQHSDTDGDGILDCPYRITGKLETPKTDSSDYWKKKMDELEQNTKPSQTVAAPKKTDSSEDKMDIEEAMPAVAGIVFGLPVAAHLVASAIKKKKQK